MLHVMENKKEKIQFTRSTYSLCGFDSLLDCSLVDPLLILIDIPDCSIKVQIKSG
uniref:Uncharacterized protein n=1 Tax=Rhizophora mucronata TaxID=61149 RepID=A0A2P2N4M8_RHIMU